MTESKRLVRVTINGRVHFFGRQSEAETARYKAYIERSFGTLALDLKIEVVE